MYTRSFASSLGVRLSPGFKLAFGSFLRTELHGIAGEALGIVLKPLGFDKLFGVLADSLVNDWRLSLANALVGGAGGIEQYTAIDEILGRLKAVLKSSAVAIFMSETQVAIETIMEVVEGWLTTFMDEFESEIMPNYIIRPAVEKIQDEIDKLAKNGQKQKVGQKKPKKIAKPNVTHQRHAEAGKKVCIQNSRSSDQSAEEWNKCIVELCAATAEEDRCSFGAICARSRCQARRGSSTTPKHGIRGGERMRYRRDYANGLHEIVREAGGMVTTEVYAIHEKHWIAGRVD
jgi:hypothetical protein